MNKNKTHETVISSFFIQPVLTRSVPSFHLQVCIGRKLDPHREPFYSKKKEIGEKPGVDGNSRYLPHSSNARPRFDV